MPDTPTTDTASGQPQPTVQVIPCRDRLILLDRVPKVVGIVNITDDSFFDGGKHFSTEAAIAHGLKLVGEGAAMLDIGGQSTRSGYKEISPEEEISRVVPVISALSEKTFVPISVDTYKPAVAEAALKAGAHLVNDIYGFQKDPRLVEIVAQYRCGAILMHNDAGFNAREGDPVAGELAYFVKSLEIAERCGVFRDRLILDPGIGFSKTHEQNLALLGRIGELHSLGLPLFLGASRKSVIGNVLGLPVTERLEGTLATTALAAWQGVEFIRVHDVLANLRAALMTAAIRRQILS